MSTPYEFRMAVSAAHLEAFKDFAEVVNPEGIAEHNIYMQLTSDGNAPTALNSHHYATAFPSDEDTRLALNGTMSVLAGIASLDVLTDELAALVVRTDVQLMFADLKWCMVARYGWGDYAKNEILSSGGDMTIEVGEVLTVEACFERVGSGLYRYIP